ncbi:MAG: hypothetical protein M5U34_26790 [Chloroflexi bacterium]|nr:hypothetical protein [Chloroflexota bacterium]
MGGSCIFEDVNLLINRGDRIGHHRPQQRQQRKKDHLAASSLRRTGEPMAILPPGSGGNVRIRFLPQDPSSLHQSSPCWKPSSERRATNAAAKRMNEPANSQRQLQDDRQSQFSRKWREPKWIR